MNIIPFDAPNLPARSAKVSKVTAALLAHAGVGGFPVLSIKGKVFTMVKNEERKIITRPDDPEEAATSLDVVIVGANDKKSKVYYKNGFEDGVSAKPECYSNNGVKQRQTQPSRSLQIVQHVSTTYGVVVTTARVLVAPLRSAWRSLAHHT